jgi:hypothetical protein
MTVEEQRARHSGGGWTHPCWLLHTSPLSASSDARLSGTTRDGHRIPTRTGNSELGWIHFSRPHNITSCRLINAALDGKPDKKSDQQRNLEYRGSALHRGRQVDFVVKVRYAKKTDDGRCTAPGTRGRSV